MEIKPTLVDQSKVEKNGYKSYGLRNGLEWDSGTGSGDEVIYLVDFDLDKQYDVSKYKKLPDRQAHV